MSCGNLAVRWIVRDRLDAGLRYDLAQVRACLTRRAEPMSISESQSLRPVFSSVVSYLQAELPIFVPCFNNPIYVSGMVSQLRVLGFLRIVLVDGGSEYPPMRDLLS